MNINDIVTITRAVSPALAKVTKITDDAIFAQLVPGGCAYEYTKDDLTPCESPNAESDWLYGSRYGSRTDWWLFEQMDAEREKATGRHDWWMLPRDEVEVKVNEQQVNAKQPSSSALAFQHTCLECGTHFNGSSCSRCGSDESILYTQN